ncbi:MAG TPA: GAF domain-containing sensor histidine kinase, partial [Streptosporangiaceae bacterium]
RAADPPPPPQGAGAMANGTLRDPAAVAPSFATPTVQRVAAGVLMPLVTVVVAAIGLRARAAGGISALDAVAVGLVLAWALAGAVATRPRDRAPQWQVASGALAASVALAAARLAGQAGGQHEAARAVATIAGPLVIAISFHFLLALPDGRLAGRARRIAAALGYASAVGTGLGLAIAGQPFPLPAGALIWPLAVLCTLPAIRLRYAATTGRGRERMQWLGIGVVVAADIALTSAVLHVLVGWPGPLGPVAAGATAAIPLGLIAGGLPALAPHGGRLLVQVLSIAGFSVVVAVVYLVIVLGLGKSPGDAADREILGLSMLAAAVAAIGYLPARDRLIASATRFVYGAREAPDEVLRTFGSRLTRAIAMDELLLQLAESLRKTMGLTSAEVYTGSGDVLERAASVPDLGRRSLVITARERPVVTRAGVSGSAWASVWLPSLLDGRAQAQLRVAPISHGGELLGLIVVERPATADAFSEEDDRVLTELARQTGLAFHNVQLDAALQTTLDELRNQADALRESRARIVASGDAERRRVERNLHDGAQQHLVALAVNLRLARDIIADDPEAGLEILDQMADDVQVTIRELRELAHGIYPPLLADSGLAEALRAAAGRCAIPVGVVADDIGRYSPQIEAAIYFCCLEALQNAAKHAPSASAEVRLWLHSGGLLFSVTDDGPGFDEQKARGGHGFINMADRLGAIGGTVRWESRPGHGSTISGSVPIG